MLTDIKIDILKKLKGNPISLDEFIYIEKELDIKLPSLFRELNSLCSYEYTHSFAFFNFGAKGEYGVSHMTKTLWTLYPSDKKYLHLYSDDAGILLMDLNEQASVMWCSIYDLENYLYDKPMSMKYDFFPTFTDFFSYLLDEEEKERAEVE